MKVPLLPEFMHEQLQRQTVWRGGDRAERMSKEQTDTASAKKLEDCSRPRAPQRLEGYKDEKHLELQEEQTDRPHRTEGPDADPDTERAGTALRTGRKGGSAAAAGTAGRLWGS